MQAFTEAQIRDHADFLAEKVFQVESKWPHFRQLLADVERLADETPRGATVVSLERGLLYGALSLFAPFFGGREFLSIDCSPASADERGAYNAAMVDDPRCLRVTSTRRAEIEATGLEDGAADLVIVPNLVHHVADQDRLFAEIARITRPGGKAYIFEPIVRELHQIPDDYIRYTPFGAQHMLRKFGLEPERFEVEGGPFSTIAYCWTQALQYFPEAQRADMERWFFDEHFPELMRWDEQHRENLVRPHTQFPMSFSILARKP